MSIGNPVRALSLVAAALGLGFYRFWHVPTPDAGCDNTDTRRADRSMVGPVALGVLATGCWLGGRVCTAALLHRRVDMPFTALPLAAQTLVGVGVLAAVIAIGWWLVSVPARVRVGRELLDGNVVRLPDDAPSGHQPLHVAATHLGRALLARSAQSPEAQQSAETVEAVAALRAAARVLAHGNPPGEPGWHGQQELRVRRRCEATAHRLERTPGRTDRRATSVA